MERTENIWSAIDLMEHDSDARKAFSALTTTIGLSGWDVVRSSQLSPEKAKLALARFVAGGIMQVQGSGLEGYYAPTGFGFLVKEQLEARRAG